MSETTPTYNTPTPSASTEAAGELLSAERLAEIYSTLDREALWRNESEETAACYVRDVNTLLAEVRRLQAAHLPHFAKLQNEFADMELQRDEALRTIERATKQLEDFDGVRSELELLGCSHDGFPTVLDAQLHDLWKSSAPLYQLEEARARLATETAAAAEAKERLKQAGHRAEDATATVRELLAEFYAGGGLCTQAGYSPFGQVPIEYINGINDERERNNAWVAMKCRELGVAFPPAQAPHAGIQQATPAAAGTPGAEGRCHGCGLPAHAARCRTVGCPMKGGAAGG